MGGATKLLQSETIDCIIYDLDKTKCVPIETSFSDVLKTEAVFIAVPTPITLKPETYGKCNTTIVSSVIKQLQEANYTGKIIVRSTVPIGYCDSFECSNIHFMPEFLTEKNWANDFINCKLWVFGVSPFCSEPESNEIKTWFQRLIDESGVKNKECSFVSTKEGEMVKYFRNCFLAVKVSFCNEMYRFALSHNMNYEAIRNIACADERIGHSHSFVPGHDGKFGIGMKCLPKELASFEAQCKEQNVRSDVVSAVIKRNNEVDRPEKDWIEYL